VYGLFSYASRRQLIVAGRWRSGGEAVGVTIAADIETEQAALAKSLTAAGPSAPTACGHWTALDLAAHLVSEERSGGVVTFLGRSLAARGIPVVNPKGIEKLIHRERRHSFEALVDRLCHLSPRLLLRPSMAPVTLFEFWMHHDDLTEPNGLEHGVPPHLYEVIPSLVHCQSRRLPADGCLILGTSDGSHEWKFGPKAGPQVTVRGPADDLVRWLGGRAP
jgi:uncharacterized protein (TIGR03083 family)